MQIGLLDQRITFRAVSNVSDTAGGVERTWVDFAVAPTVWASVRAVSGREQLENGAINASGIYRFVVRNRSDVSELDAIIWGGQNYNIRNVERMGARPNYLTIIAERGVAP